MLRWLWIPFALAADLPTPATGQCEGEGTGADSWFTGELVITDGQVEGIERWHIHPNGAWARRGAKECTLTWTVAGTVGTPGKCTDCDLSVTFRAEPLAGTEGCPEELMKGRLRPDGQRVGSEFGIFENKYDIRRTAEGDATVYFGKSGTQLGTGKSEGDKISWISRHQCKWF